MGYPCVGWLLLLRRRYTHRCLQIWLPPAASDWIQGWDSAPQNTTRKHKMAPRTSAILGLLKRTIRSTFEGVFFQACCLMIKKERLFNRERWRITLVPSTETKPTDPDDTLAINGYKVREQLQQNLSDSRKVHREKHRHVQHLRVPVNLLVPWTVRLWHSHWTSRLYFWFLKHFWKFVKKGLVHPDCYTLLGWASRLTWQLLKG